LRFFTTAALSIFSKLRLPLALGPEWHDRQCAETNDPTTSAGAGAAKQTKQVNIASMCDLRQVETVYLIVEPHANAERPLDQFTKRLQPPNQHIALKPA
jgi:hypothetical protein